MVWVWIMLWMLPKSSANLDKSSSLICVFSCKKSPPNEGKNLYPHGPYAAYYEKIGLSFLVWREIMHNVWRIILTRNITNVNLDRRYICQKIFDAKCTVNWWSKIGCLEETNQMHTMTTLILHILWIVQCICNTSVGVYISQITQCTCNKNMFTTWDVVRI
jgi:hypothetical protein